MRIAPSSKKTQKIEKQIRKDKSEEQQSNQKQRRKYKLSKNKQESNNDEDNDQNSDQDSDEENDEDSDHNDSDDEDSEQDQDSQSEVKIDPSKFAIKQMKFRQKRGTKMNYLISRKKQQQDDPFWINNPGYFGDLDGDEGEEQSYVQSSSGRDYFDSDFDQTQSEHEQQEEGKPKPQEIDENKEKERKKRHQLMMKIKNPQINENKKEQQKKKTKTATKNGVQQMGNKYIHQVCTQQQLLGQAAHTQYFNWLSYRKLISLQVVKKDYTRKKHNIDGAKVIYRDKIINGQRKVTYQLEGIDIKSVKQLSDLWDN